MSRSARSPGARRTSQRSCSNRPHTAAPKHQDPAAEKEYDEARDDSAQSAEGSSQKDESAAEFYHKHGFEPVPDDPLKLFLPLPLSRKS